MSIVTSTLFSKPAAVYDRIKAYWLRRNTERKISLFLICFFLAASAVIAFNRMGWLPEPMASKSPTDFFAAIRLAFTLILIMEVIALVFAIAESVSLAAGKQLEIMALLLLREAFTDISQLDLPTVFESNLFPLVQIGLVAFSGLILFVIRGVFSRWHYVHSYNDMSRYVEVKKCLSLLLLCTFSLVLCYDLYQVVVMAEQSIFFSMFYTALIFTDILLVLVGQYFAPSFQATFRNSGFAVSTLLMRIAIGAPHHISALLCVFAGLYLLALNWALLRFITADCRKQGNCLEITLKND